MEKFLFLFQIAVSATLLTSCSYMEAPHARQIQPEYSDSDFYIGETEAIEIADEFLGKNKTTSKSCLSPALNYICNETKSKAAMSDTLAYVINYPNGTGFAIVSADKRMNPVLAFSDTGAFNIDNELARYYFTDHIGDYFESVRTPSPKNNINGLNGNQQYRSEIIGPHVKITISQNAPWNKFVTAAHPGCPAGCVPVATALIFIHARDTLGYHGSTYLMKPIIRAIEKGQHPDYDFDDEYEDASLYPIYSYSQAVDSVAKLLYWIGKDEFIEYTTKESYGEARHVYALCQKLGFSTEAEGNSAIPYYDTMEVYKAIKDGNILYAEGRRTDDRSKGHAWVIDGCHYAILPNNTNPGSITFPTDPTKPTVTDINFHCDWGWGGECNGYFSGDVFAASSTRQYKVDRYIPVKLENLKK